METVKAKPAPAPPTFSQRLLTCALVSADKLAAARATAGGDDEALASHLLREGLLTPFQVRQLRAGATSFHVDKYVVLDCIGRGGHGIVFKARQTQPPHRLVALKTLDSNSLHKSDEALSRFRREIAIVIRLQHPNVVRAYEVIRTRSQIYLVLEYVEGEDLASVVKRRGPLPVHEAVGHVLQAASGLAHAHKLGVVHRDLKPANLLLTREGAVKLSDLGLARFGEEAMNSELTMKGACLGTPEFMAPEQAEDATRADFRSDVYSLGATLFHLLSAELPVTGKSHLQCLHRLLTQPPRSLAEVRPDLPPDLVAAVDALRCRNPADRPATAEEAVALLEPFASMKLPQSGVVKVAAVLDAGAKASLVLDVLQGRLSAEVACERHGLTPAEFEQWRRRFLEGARKAFEPARPGEDLVRELRGKIEAQAREIGRLRGQLAREDAVG